MLEGLEHAKDEVNTTVGIEQSIIASKEHWVVQARWFFFQICITLTKWQFPMQPVMSTDRIAGKRQFKVRLVSCLCHCGSVCHIRAESRFAPSQWETALLCNDVSHWLGANLESALILYAYYLSPLYFTRYRVISDPGHNGKCVRMRHRTGAGTGCISMSPIHLGPVLVCLVDMGIIFISFKQHGNLFVKQKWFGSCLICSLDLQFLAAAAKAHPLGRIGDVEDASRAIRFLASEAASFITGALLPVDGGRSGCSPMKHIVPHNE